MIEVLRSGQLSLGPRVPRVRAGVRRAARRPARQRGLQRHRRPAPRAARGRRGGGRRGRHEPVLVRRLGQRRSSTSARGRSSPTSTRSRSTSTRTAAAGGGHRAHDGAAARAHLRLPGRPAGVRAAAACRSSRTPARRSAPSTPTASPVGGRGHPAVFGFYANKQLTTGEGGMVALGDAAMKERIDSERNQGRAPDMGWLDHDRLGFNYRLSDIACAIGLVQLERLDGMLADRARVAGCVPRGARRRSRASTLPCPDAGGERARLVRVRRPAAARRRPRRDGRARSPSAGSRASPTCRRST